MLLPIIGLLIGVAIGLVANIHIPAEYSSYVAIAILAALDSVFGAISASMQKNFNLTGIYHRIFRKCIDCSGAYLFRQAFGCGSRYGSRIGVWNQDV